MKLLAVCKFANSLKLSFCYGRESSHFTWWLFNFCFLCAFSVLFLLDNTEELMGDNCRVMSSYEDLLIDIMQLYSDTVDYSFFSQKTSSRHFSFARSFGVPSQLQISLPGRNDAHTNQCIRNFSHVVVFGKRSKMNVTISASAGLTRSSLYRTVWQTYQKMESLADLPPRKFLYNPMRICSLVTIFMVTYSFHDFNSK